ncbi:MAG: hypothetical protein ACO20H_05930 [Bacteriovoracaceae bacterium]
MPKILFIYFIFSPLVFAQYDEGERIDMRGWSDQQKRSFYEYQRKARENQYQMERDSQINEVRGQALEGVFRNLLESSQQKLERARELRKSAESNQRVGFGKLDLNFEDYINRKVSNIQVKLGTSKHRYGCYSRDNISMGFAAQTGVNGHIELLANNVGQGPMEELIVTIKNGMKAYKFTLRGGMFRRYGNRTNGEIAILSPSFAKNKNNKVIGKINRGRLTYYGCAKDDGPSGSSGYGGENEGSGGYGGGGY